MSQPLCAYFGKCGGCSSQHIDYPIQLENKKKVLVNSINFSNINIFHGNEYFYRNKMEMIFHQNSIGLRKKDEPNKIIDIEKCVISNERINELIKEIRDFFKEVDYFDAKRKTGAFMQAVIRAPTNNSAISFVLNEESSKLRETVEKIEAFAAISSANTIIVSYVNPQTEIPTEYFVVKGNEMLKEKYLGKEFVFHAQGFFQNNHEVAERMHQYCNELLKLYNTKEAHLLDLYGGVGTFGLTNAELFKGVTIIENAKESIEAANINMQNNNIKNAKATVLDTKHLKKVQLPQPLFVITDPPRSGMDLKTIEQLNALKPKAIIYISCNIQQLAKDIPKFKGYKIKSAALFDLFPQTPHIEAIVELIL